MPSRNTLKMLVENCYYHVYNRGVNKETIFNDERDYQVFLYYLKRNLFPKEDPEYEEFSEKVRPFQRTDLEKKIDLLCFCLMPNHFHLLVYLKEKQGLPELMRRLCNGYVSYYNERWERIGPLFQGRYKGIFIENEEYLLHLSRYIHLNPFKGELIKNRAEISNYSFSSYPAYMGEREVKWLKLGVILDYFRSGKSLLPRDILSYQAFVEGFDDETTGQYTSGLTLE